MGLKMMILSIRWLTVRSPVINRVSSPTKPKLAVCHHRCWWTPCGAQCCGIGLWDPKVCVPNTQTRAPVGRFSDNRPAPQERQLDKLAGPVSKYHQCPDFDYQINGLEKRSSKPPHSSAGNWSFSDTNPPHTITKEQLIPCTRLCAPHLPTVVKGVV